MKYIFHGSNATLLDEGLVVGTYFTEDLEIALKYGKKIYAIDLDNYQNIFSKTFDDHYVSHCFIPSEYLKVLELSLQKEGN